MYVCGGFGGGVGGVGGFNDQFPNLIGLCHTITTATGSNPQATIISRGSKLPE